VQKAAFDAQKAADAGDIPTALTNYNTAKAAMVNNTDKFMVGRVGYQIYQKNKDDALFSEVVDLMLASGEASVDAQKQLYFAQGQIAYNKKNYPKALTAFEKSRGWPSLDTTSIRIVSRLRDPSTRTAAINAMARAGNPVPAVLFSRWLLGDDATLSLLERVVASGRDGGGSSMNMYLALGPKLRADPRFLALLPRLGFPSQGNPAGKP